MERLRLVDRVLEELGHVDEPFQRSNAEADGDLDPLGQERQIPAKPSRCARLPQGPPGHRISRPAGNYP